jgi:hypothetical protein|tara:strand:+ start:1876 stop:2457 length:582 start_codon:yes stop_codon:yes gene_type:complete
MKNKKSFLLYTDLKETFEALTNEKAGELIKHILAYVNDENPTSDDMLINAVFANIKHTLKRDLNKWEEIKVQRSEAGRKGGLAKASNAKQRLANLAVNVNVNDNVINIYRSFNHLSISKEEFNKLNKLYSTEQIDNVLDAIENFANNKKYKSLYLTARNWLSKENTSVSSNTSADDALLKHVKTQLNASKKRK